MSIPATTLVFLMSGLLIGTNYKTILSIKLPEKIFLFAFLSIMLMMFIVNVVRYPMGIFFIMITLMAIFNTLILIRNIEVFYKASKITLYFYICLILGLCGLYGFANFPKENPIEHIVEGSSANGITSYLVIVLLNFSAISYTYKNKIPLLPIILSLVITFIGYGRSSILSVLLFFVVYIVSQYYTKNKQKVILFLSGFILLGTFLFIKYNKEIMLFYTVNTKFAGSALKSHHRERQLADYLNKLDYVTTLTGTDYSNTSIQLIYKNNPHNSFIRAHSIFGLPYLILIFTIPFVLVFFYEKSNHQIFTAAVIVIILIKAFPEPFLFPSLMDFYLISILFVPLFLQRRDKEKSLTNELSYR